jgi:hypothetical protein
MRVEFENREKKEKKKYRREGNLAAAHQSQLI